MLLPLKYRQPVLLGLLLLSVFSLFVSRAGLSISMIAFVAVTTLHRGIGAQLRRVVTNPTLLGMTLLFAVPLVSGLWSDDTGGWAGAVRIKLPLLFFPLAFAGSWQLTQAQWRFLALFFAGCVSLGAAGSLGLYLENAAAHNEGFLRAKTFSTPLESDHVRFSWLVTVAQLTLLALWKDGSRVQRWCYGTLLLFLTVYLHVLSARTGLGAFYLLLGMAALRLLFQKRSWKLGLAAGIAVVALPLLALRFLPSFQNRVAYIRYDLPNVLNGSYQMGANDGNRFLSIRAGIDLLRQHPGGIGFGDIQPASNAWFDAHVPGMIRSDRFLPSSEWLMYGLGAGWIGVLLFTASMALPLLDRSIRRSFLWFVLNCGAAFSFLFDIGLEVQYGVYGYVFLILWWWKWLTPETGQAE
ncbi:hypothetical protein [Flaviaesturariibacter amylovorans]|uniref:O-antigen ligase domain-containing protein n=1 Tax=Flaviaesturariibacter amylovorans TaxID=1084520 RepID=A0ABP8HJG0_9BACT